MVQDRELSLYEPTKTDLERMPSLMEKYRDTPMDLADASLVSAAETLAIGQIFTLDRHFRAYRFGANQAFEIVP